MAWPDQLARCDASLIRHFGQPTTYRPATASSVVVAGIFDSAYIRVEAGDPGVASAAPMVFYREVSLPVPPDADGVQVEVGGRLYDVREAIRDGQGGVRLFLSGAARQ